MKTDQNKMIEDLIKMLDGGATKGVGHVNVEVHSDNDASEAVQTMGCADCSINPTACSIPTLLDDPDEK